MSEAVGNVRKHENSGVTWVDALRPDQGTLKKLEQTYKLHPVHVRESLQKVQHTEVEKTANYLFLVLREPVYEASTHKLSIRQMGIFLGKDFVLTVRSGEVPAVERVIDQVGDYKHGSAYMVYLLINAVLSDMFAISDHIESELDNIENRVFGDSSSDAQRIGRIRQKIVRLSRLVGPKRAVLDNLTQQVISFAGKDMRPYYQNNVRMVTRLWEVVEEERETVEIFKDADFTTSTEQTNKTLAVLTVIFTLTIPTTTVASLYGMNVLLPGGIETGAWTFLGRYTTAIVVLVASIGLAWAMYMYFRLKKWL